MCCFRKDKSQSKCKMWQIRCTPSTLKWVWHSQVIFRIITCKKDFRSINILRFKTHVEIRRASCIEQIIIPNKMRTLLLISLNSLQLLPSKLFFIAKDKISKGVSSRTNRSILWQTKTFVVIIKLLLEKKFHTEFTKHNLDLLKLFNSYYLIMRRGIVFYIGLLPVFLTFSNQPKPIAISKYICWRAEGGVIHVYILIR